MANEIVQSEENGIVHARISGLMTLTDQRALENFAKRLIDANQQVSVLVTLADFAGWEKSEAWGDDLEFQLEYGSKIVRIAIVGEERWREQALLFVGKGFRDTEIEFFSAGSAEAAKIWVEQ